MIAAASISLWNNQSACGRMMRVTCAGSFDGGDQPSPCKGQDVVIEITDFCPHCHGDIDLSQEAFGRLADHSVGVIKIHVSP
ncbi:EG45-like domain containing protein [Apostasia shenzhenica]|uniref:EG45-like domain containing protein n=1 Tax=Apostasia shenzhenica TaxID=1088818 RepID=A0A2I0B8W0_9ASPA|nr:EG45-like domain containing protein [Apostasia shenzhenica]